MKTENPARPADATMDAVDASECTSGPQSTLRRALFFAGHAAACLLCPVDRSFPRLGRTGARRAMRRRRRSARSGRRPSVRRPWCALTPSHVRHVALRSWPVGAPGALTGQPRSAARAPLELGRSCAQHRAAVSERITSRCARLVCSDSGPDMTALPALSRLC